MVLEWAVRRSLPVLLAVASSSAFSSPTPDLAATHANLTGQKISLVNAHGNCVLSRSAGELLSMGMPWPCQFTVDQDGRAHVDHSRNVPIAIVMHAVPDPDSERPLKCRTQSRAIRLFEGQLELSPISRSAACHTGIGDQKEYTGVFDW